MRTYPNQRMVTVFKDRHKQEDYKDGKRTFLQIDNEDWMAAASILTPGAFQLYLYLAANSDGFTMALSPADVYNKLGMADSTYRRAFKDLKGAGYIEHKGGHMYWFNTAV